jgi:hypothetical protein
MNRGASREALSLSFFPPFHHTQLNCQPVSPAQLAPGLLLTPAWSDPREADRITSPHGDPIGATKMKTPRPGQAQGAGPAVGSAAQRFKTFQRAQSGGPLSRGVVGASRRRPKALVWILPDGTVGCGR